MVIFQENKNNLQEATPASLDDVIGLAGFNGYRIQRNNLYVDNTHRYAIVGMATLVKGQGSISSQDVSLVCNREAIVSFPIKDIKAVGVKRLNVLFFMKDGSTIEFFRN